MSYFGPQATDTAIWKHSAYCASTLKTARKNILKEDCMLCYDNNQIVIKQKVQKKYNHLLICTARNVKKVTLFINVEIIKMNYA